MYMVKFCCKTVKVRLNYRVARARGGTHLTPCAAMIEGVPLKKYTQGVVSYFLKSSSRRQIRQTNIAILNVPDGALNYVRYGFLPRNNSHEAPDV